MQYRLFFRRKAKTMQDQFVVYPIKIKPTGENSSNYLVYLPDFQGYTLGEDYDNALFMARDYIGTRSLFNKLPPASKRLPLVGGSETALFIKVNITSFRLQHGVRANGHL